MNIKDAKHTAERKKCCLLLLFWRPRGLKCNVTAKKCALFLGDDFGCSKSRTKASLNSF
jgi:hypothetical protein